MLGVGQQQCPLQHPHSAPVTPAKGESYWVCRLWTSNAIDLFTRANVKVAAGGKGELGLEGRKLEKGTANLAHGWLQTPHQGLCLY